MHSKRVQKRKAKLPITPKKYELPDPFSAENPDLVEDEVAHADQCPCCVDRGIQLELNKLEAEYLEWTGKKDKK